MASVPRPIGRTIAASRRQPGAAGCETSSRRFGDVLLFGVTAVELAILVRLTPSFAFVDWIYLAQHLLVLVLAFTRRAPAAQDHSVRSALAVTVSYAYPYAQIAWLGWNPGNSVSQSAGVVFVTVAAIWSAASLVSLGSSFGVRPALRSLITRGPYRVVRHPIYASYVLSDVGYNLQEWNVGSLLLMLAGWVSLVYRIRAEERVLARADGWPAYVGAVRYRLVPRLW